MTKFPLACLVLLCFGCVSEPVGPKLPMPLTLTYPDYEEAGGLIPIVGTLELKIKTDGRASCVCRRVILTDVERRGDLSEEQSTRLVEKVEAWAAQAKESSGPPPRGYGHLVYGAKQATWEKGKPIPPELADLLAFLLTIPPTLQVLQHTR